MKKKVNNGKAVGILLLLSFLLAACSSNVVFQDSKELPDYGWNKDSVVVFNYTATDTSGIYDIIIDIRNSGSYRYQNFWLFVNSVSPDLIEFKDTLECVLADNYGKWIGKGGGSLRELPVLYMQRIKFPKTGVYRFELIQGMREDTLVGIHDIGLRIISLNE
ncbi:MAG: gliding motility lipoprotein GldH [Prevotellaceae bacterium]|jgi:gliding motility-associated lipoprotein GldH|nr:gliding motility lipoprotein GldH [Prevotellaceae bacterium]